MKTGDTRYGSQWKIWKASGNGDATQRLATTGNCCYTLAGGTEGRWGGTRTRWIGMLGGSWKHTRPETTQWNLELRTQRRHYQCCVTTVWQLFQSALNYETSICHSSFNPESVVWWVSQSSPQHLAHPLWRSHRVWKGFSIHPAVSSGLLVLPKPPHHSGHTTQAWPVRARITLIIVINSGEPVS